MNKHPIFWFYVLAFGLSWSGWIPVAAGSQGITPFTNPNFQFLLLLAMIGPMLAAIIVTQAVYSKTAVRSLLKPLLQWRVGLVWYLVAVFVPLFLLVAGQALTQLLGLPRTATGLQGDLFPLAISAFLMSLFSNPWEEVGWRGFALPHLQKRYTALQSTLIVGVLWGLWHLPLFFWTGNPMSQYPFLPWLVGTVAQAFMYTWLYNSTRGSLLLVSLFHIAFNTFGVVVSGVSVIALMIWQCLIAIALVIAFGQTNLSRQERVYTD